MLLPDNQFTALQRAKTKLKQPRYPESPEEVFRKAFDKLLHAFIPGIKIYWKKKKAGIMEKIVIGKDEFRPQLLRGKVVFVQWHKESIAAFILNGRKFIEYDVDQLLQEYECKF